MAWECQAIENALSRTLLTVTGREILKISIYRIRHLDLVSLLIVSGTLDEAVRKFEKSLLLQLYQAFLLRDSWRKN